jgi:hypothetical protein
VTSTIAASIITCGRRTSSCSINGSICAIAGGVPRTTIALSSGADWTARSGVEKPVDCGVPRLDCGSDASGSVRGLEAPIAPANGARLVRSIRPTCRHWRGSRIIARADRRFGAAMRTSARNRIGRLALLPAEQAAQRIE